MRRQSMKKRWRVWTRRLPRAADMDFCGSERVRLGKPCRPSSLGGGNSRRATWRRCACSHRARTGPPALRCPAGRGSTDRIRPRWFGADGAHDAGIRISDDGRPGGALGRTGGGFRHLACRGENQPAELPEGSPSSLESGWTGAFQSRGKSPRPGMSVRLHGNLYDAAFRAGQGTAFAAWSGLARVRGGREQRQAPVSPFAECNGLPRHASGSSR